MSACRGRRAEAEERCRTLAKAKYVGHTTPPAVVVAVNVVVAALNVVVVAVLVVVLIVVVVNVVVVVVLFL